MAKKKASAKATEETQIEEKATAAVGADPGYVASLAAESEKPKEPEIELVDELIRYEFTERELVEMAGGMADVMAHIERQTAEKKSAASAFDSEIKKATLDLQELGQNIRDGFDMRKMPCYLVKDFARRKAYYLRADLYELNDLKGPTIDELRIDLDAGSVEAVKIRDIKSWELQRHLEFESGENENPAEVDENENL